MAKVELNNDKNSSLTPLEALMLEAESLEYEYRPSIEKNMPGITDHPTLTFWWGNKSVRGDSQVSMTTYRRLLDEGMVQVFVKDFPELAAARPDLVDGDTFVQDGQVLMAMPKKWAKSRLAWHEGEVERVRKGATNSFLRDASPVENMPIIEAPRVSARFSSKD